MSRSMRVLCLAGVLSGVAATVVVAQDVAPAAPAQSSPARGLLLADGTEISVKTVGELSGKSAAVGDVFTWRVNKPVVVDGYVVIAEGAPVKGTVTEAKRAGMMGKSGKLNIKIETTKSIDGQIVKLRASQGKSGEGRTGTTVALVVLFGPLGLMKHGKDAVIADGTLLSVFADEDIRVVKTP